MADIKAMNPAHKEIPIAEFKKKDGTVTAVMRRIAPRAPSLRMVATASAVHSCGWFGVQTLEESMPPAAVDLAIGLLRSGRAVATAAGHTPLHSAAPLVSSYLIAEVGRYICTPPKC